MLPEGGGIKNAPGVYEPPPNESLRPVGAGHGPLQGRRRVGGAGHVPVLDDPGALAVGAGDDDSLVVGEPECGAVEVGAGGRAHLDGDRLEQDNWQAAMDRLRESEMLPVEGLQRVWWLFPLYRERPGELVELLEASQEVLRPDEETAATGSGAHDKSSGELGDLALEAATPASNSDADNESSKVAAATRAESSEHPAEAESNEAVADGDDLSTATPTAQSESRTSAERDTDETTDNDDDGDGIVGRIRKSLFGD